MQNSFFLKEPFVDILEEPKKNSNVSSQLIYGESFKIISKKNNYFKIKTSYDKYSGFIKKIDSYEKFNPTHKVGILKARIYLGNKKEKSKKFLPFTSKIQILKRDQNFIMYKKDKWLRSKDIFPIQKKNSDFVKIFKSFLNCKYKWGGKTFEGIDCSALLQIFYKFNNNFFPRDTIDQVKLKKGVGYKKKFKKGDIIFWKGHVAICINTNDLIHAYGPKKRVIIMPIKKTIKLIKETAKLDVKKVTRI